MSFRNNILFKREYVYRIFKKINISVSSEHITTFICALNKKGTFYPVERYLYLRLISTYIYRHIF